MDKIHQKISATHIAPEWESKPNETCSLAPEWESKPSETCSLAPRGRGVGRGGKVAFTLAEVLITLGIIGVVAAMTLPSLIQNYQKKALATQTQKFYSMMSQAVKQYMADYGVDDLRNTPLASDNYGEGSWDDGGNNYIPPNGKEESLRDFATKYLKVVKECEYIENDDGSADSSCYTPLYRLWDNSISEHHPTGFDYVLADGSTISIYYIGIKGDPGPIELYVDVNGKKGPNRVGYDLWSMSIFYDGVIDESGVTPECRKEGVDCDSAVSNVNTPAEAREGRFDSCKRDNPYGGCFGHLLNNNFKFDY